MSKVFEYKGFQGTAECSVEEGVLHGKILHITDLVDYNADTLADLKTEFEAAVDDYLELCAELGCEPSKPASGTFNVRVGPELHTRANMAATRQGISLNEFVKAAVATAVADAPVKHQLHVHLHQNEGVGTRFTAEMPVSIQRLTSHPVSFAGLH